MDLDMSRVLLYQVSIYLSIHPLMPRSIHPSAYVQEKRLYIRIICYLKYYDPQNVVSKTLLKHSLVYNMPCISAISAMSYNPSPLELSEDSLPKEPPAHPPCSTAPSSDSPPRSDASIALGALWPLPPPAYGPKQAVWRWVGVHEAAYVRYFIWVHLATNEALKHQRISIYLK